MKESEVQRQILDYLEATRVVHWRIDAGRMSPPDKKLVGFPDIVGLLPNSNGKAFFIEVKAPKARPRKHEDKQREVHKIIRNANGLMIEANCLDDVRRIIKHHL